MRRTPRPVVPAPRGSLRHRLASLGLATVLALMAALAAGSSASAHDALESSTPADGAHVPTAPRSVDLSFTAPVLPLGAAVVVTGPDGTTVSSGEPQVVGATVVQELAAGLPAGTYTVAWQVTSGDGHPITGGLTFVADATAPGAAVEPGPAGSTTATAAAPTAEARSVPAGVTSALVAAGVVATLVLVAAVVVLLRRRAPRPAPGA